MPANRKRHPYRKTRVPSYRLHKPSGQAVVRLNGKDFYLGKHSTPESHQAYERLTGEWLANHRQLPAELITAEDRQPDAPKQPPVLSINELFLAYWDFCQGYYVKNGQPTSEVASIKRAMQTLLQRYGAMPVTSARINEVSGPMGSPLVCPSWPMQTLRSMSPANWIGLARAVFLRFFLRRSAAFEAPLPLNAHSMLCV